MFLHFLVRIFPVGINHILHYEELVIRLVIQFFSYNWYL